MSGNIRYVKGPDTILGGASAQAEDTGVFTVTNATNLFNDVAHGLVAGQCITIKVQTTIPTGLTAGLYYYVISVLDDSFQVALTPGGSAVTFSDDGTGTLTWAKEVEGHAIDVSLYKHPVLIINSASSADVTLLVVGSHSKTPPTFIEPASATNLYDNLNLIDQEDAAAIAGDTGVVIAADETRQIAINTNGMHWINVKTLNYFGGDLQVSLKSYSNN